MNDINQVFYMGRLARDAAFRTTPTGYQITELIIASNYEPKGKNSDDKEVCFIKCTLWNQEAEKASQLKKGEEVMVIGRLKYEKWTDKKTGLERTGHSLAASQIMYNEKLSEHRLEEQIKEVRQVAQNAVKPRNENRQIQTDFDDGLPF